MEYYYNGEKNTKEPTEIIADLLEESELDLDENNIELFIEMCEKNILPKRYYTNDILDFDKIIDDKKHLEEVIMEYSISKINI